MAAIPVGGSTASRPSAHTTDPKADTTPKRPTGEDGKAAKTAPEETSTAVQNTFGKVPGGGKQPDTNAKQPGNGAKAPADNPKAGSDTPKAPSENPKGGVDTPKAPVDNPKTGGDAPKAPVDNPKAGSDAPKDAAAPSDAAAPKEGAAPDGKTASPDAGAARQPAAPQAGQATTPPAGDAKQPAGTDSKLPVAGQDIPKSSMFYGATDPKHGPGDYAKTADGKDYAKTADGKFYIQYNRNNDAVAVDDKNNVVRDPFGNAYALNNKGEFATTPAKDPQYQYYIVYYEKLGGKAVATKFQKDEPVSYGNAPRVLGPDGNFAKTVDGKDMVYPPEAGGKMAATKGFLPFENPQNKPYLVRPDGTYAVTVDGKYMVFDDTPNGRYYADTGGGLRTDPKGNAYMVSADGNYLQPEPGKFAVVNRYDKAVAADAFTGEVVKDTNGHAYVLDNTGKYMQPEAGKFAVYNDQTGKTIATDGKGNAVTDANGNPYLVGDDGKYVKTEDGNYAVYTPKLAVKDLTLYRNEKQEEMVTADGLSLYQDKTGKFVGVSPGGMVVEIDPVSGKMVTDADGKPILLNDPYAERPRGGDNMNPYDTLSRLPIGVEDGDPMVIKNELFKDGVLDNDLLYAALAKYDVRDVYDALINASKFGGWNNTPPMRYGGQDRIIHPEPSTARMMIAGLIAWNNDNGPYKPLREGDLPFMAVTESDRKYLGVMSDDHKVVQVQMGPNGLSDDFKAQATLYHELNHSLGTEEFRNIVKDGFYSRLYDNNEVITEYLANQWSENWDDSFYDVWPGMRVMDDIVNIMGGGDHRAGVDILKRAYFQTDPVAVKTFLAAVKKRGVERFND